MARYSASKVFEMYLVLFIASNVYFRLVHGFILETVLNLKSFDYGPCKPDQQNGCQNFSLLDLDIQVTDDGNLDFHGSFEIGLNVTSPLKATINMQKNVFGYRMPIPCLRAFGSCTISDLCKYLAPRERCPNADSNELDVPGECPIEAGRYKLPEMNIVHLAKTWWPYLFTGTYEAEITLYQDDKEMTCYKIDFTLE